MKRTTIFLPEEVHKNLKYLALEHNQTMAELLREAIEKVYKNDLLDISLATQARQEYKNSSKGSIKARSFFGISKK